MALVPNTTPQYDLGVDPLVQLPVVDTEGAISIARATLVLTASGTGTADMIALPAGKKWILPHLSCVSAPDGANSSDLNVGYHPLSGVAILTHPEYGGLADSLDLGGGPLVNQAFSGGKVGGGVSPVPFDSAESVAVNISIDTANGLTGTYELCLAYVMGSR
jgi:hypothetical protein